MAEFFAILWTIFSFILGILWSIVWFILSDLLSTLAWVAIFVWFGFALRYRSFSLGTLSLLRYVRYGFGMVWRWLRGRPADAAQLQKPVTKVVREVRHRVPLGYASLSEEMNILLVLLVIIMANL